ncbi:hypothetical protein ACIGNX_32760 [Actinosynnema sp. NPDC053489]|uniref:hypothetical protein n=1 Tax=Actinosynnema sp. NPDC053489 TaxID=3363916 RepID=UPI0037CCBBFB
MSGPRRGYLRTFLLRWVPAVLVGAALVLGVYRVLDPQASLEDVVESSGPVAGFFAVLLVTGLVRVLVAARRHPRSVRTSPAAPELARLRDSADDFCLLLRPFGHDGAVVVGRGRRRGVLTGDVTLEEALALAFRRVLDVPTYAIVDQDLEFATPGPVYLRASNDEWRGVVRELIVGARHIVLLLPDGQEEPDIRVSFAWELEQIAAFGLQHRVLLVLPPHRRADDGRAYRVALRQACVILAAMEAFVGTVDEVDPLRVAHYERILKDTTYLVNVWHGPPAPSARRVNPVLFYLRSGRTPVTQHFVDAVEAIEEAARETDLRPSED